MKESDYCTEDCNEGAVKAAAKSTSKLVGQNKISPTDQYVKDQRSE